MARDHFEGPSPRDERGIALVTVVFLVLVLGVVAAGLAELASKTAFGALESADSAQAYFAAEAGLVRSLREGAAYPTPVGFGGATYTVADVPSNPGSRLAIGRKGLATRRVSAEPAFAYVPFSRIADSDSEVEFRLENVTGAARTLTAIRITWGGVVAHCEEVRIRVLGGTNFGILWSSVAAGGDRLSSGEVGSFNSGALAAVIPAGATVRVRLSRFRAAETGAAALVDMDGEALRVETRAGLLVFGQSTVRVGGW